MKGGHILIVKWNLSAHQDEKDNSEAPDVDFGACVRLRLQQLRGGEVETAAVGLEPPVFIRGEEVAKTKIDDLDVASLTDQDIFYLQVPMHNTVAMAVVDGTGYLPCELAGLLLLKFAVGNDVIQHLAAIDVFEQHIPVPSRPQVVAEPAYVLVVQEAHYGSLARVSVLSRSVSLVPLLSALAAIIGRHPFDDFACDLWEKVVLD